MFLYKCDIILRSIRNLRLIKNHFTSCLRILHKLIFASYYNSKLRLCMFYYYFCVSPNLISSVIYYITAKQLDPSYDI